MKLIYEERKGSGGLFVHIKFPVKTIVVTSLQVFYESRLDFYS